MMISKISAYTYNAKKYLAPKKNISFEGSKCSDVKKCSAQYDADFFKNCDGYKTIITYNEIVSLKKLAEKSKVGKDPDNLAVVFVGDSVGDLVFATGQQGLIDGKPTWTNVTDYDSF